MANYSEIKDDLIENTTKYLKSIAMDLMVVAVALAYVFYQMVSLETTQLNPLILIAQALVGIIAGVVIKQALGENGFSKGYNSTKWNTEEEKYNETCAKANNYIDERLDNFYLTIEKEKKANYRRNHLQAVRLKYQHWFNDNGDYIGDEQKFNQLTRRQKYMVKKCIRVRIYVLNLFSEYANSDEQDTKKEKTDKTQRFNNMTRNTLSAVLIALLGAYFVPIINGWSWASFITATLQVSLWTIFGVIQLYQNYNFVVQDRVAILRKKKELILRFIKGCENNQFLQSPYSLVDDNTDRKSLVA